MNVLFTSFLMGLASMTYFHNFFVSILLYRTGQAHVSNILKIIFNFSGVAKSIIMYASAIVIVNITQTQCSSLSYLSILANFFYRQALAGFLLWRLKQIEYSAWDTRLSFCLYFARTVLNMLIFGYVKPELLQDQNNNTWICNQGKKHEFLAIQLSFIGIDFIIDSFVTARLVQILNDGNRNAAEVNLIIGRKRRKRTLFTAVLYWNFFRLTIDFLYNGITVLNTVGFNSPILDGLLCFATIAQSYLITVDAEIVKVIEGRSPTDEWSNNRLIGNGGDDSRSNFSPPLPITTRGMREDSITSRYQRIVQSWTSPSSRHRSQYSPPSTWMRESSLRQQQTASFRLDKGKFVVVSMQRLTFFEWANIVTGSDNNNGSNDQGSETPGGFGGFSGLKWNSNKTSGVSIEGSPQRSAEDRDTVELVDCNNNSFPELAHLSQSRRGSDTSTMSNSSTQTKINDIHFVSDMNYKHSFI